MLSGVRVRGEVAQRLSSTRPLVAAWAVTRVLLVVFTGVRALPESWWFASAADLYSYERWADFIADTGTYPLSDDTWQYPPGVGPLLSIPRVLPGLGYWWWFLALVVAADAAVLWLLVRTGRTRGNPLAGAWVWTAGVVLLGRVCYGRFDLIVSAVAAAALLCVARRPALAGALAAVGALLKVWPAAVLVGLHGRRLGRAVAGFAVTLAAAGAALAAAWPGAWSFLRFQSARGIQIESVAATPLMVARAAGANLAVVHRYGAEELLGPGVGAATAACLLATVLAAVLVGVMWLRTRRRLGAGQSVSPAAAADATLFAVLLAMATSRVLSPQYVVWAVAVAAVCAVLPGTSQWPVIALVLAAAALTQLEYPFLYDRISSWPGTLVLAARNGIVIWSAVWSGIRLWRSTAIAEHVV